MMWNAGTKFFLLFFFSCLWIGCEKSTQVPDEKVTLSIWIDDKKNYEQLISFFEQKECEQAEKLLTNFKTSQFKSQSYLPLARCFADDKEKSKYYLTEAIKEGYHIKLIDSVIFKSVWKEIKAAYPKLNQEYWSQQDTTYFKEVEQLVYLDQKVRYDSPVGSDDFSAEIRQDSISTKYLLDICKNYGYPKPFQLSHFEFRRINPIILAVHAEDIYKREILDCAIEAAKSGKISWMTPIGIFKSFYVVRKPSGAVNPLFMLYFDVEDNLEHEKSLLQLHSIQEIYGIEMPSKITLRPSLSNNQDNTVIEKQLTQIKNSLVNKFAFDETQIKIVLVPSDETVQDDFTDSYLYTISAQRL